VKERAKQSHPYLFTAAWIGNRPVPAPFHNIPDTKIPEQEPFIPLRSDLRYLSSPVSVPMPFTSSPSLTHPAVFDLSNQMVYSGTFLATRCDIAGYQE
jgi:hypothetical protein